MDLYNIHNSRHAHDSSAGVLSFNKDAMLFLHIISSYDLKDAKESVKFLFSL